jgi:hypothetical protein
MEPIQDDIEKYHRELEAGHQYVRDLKAERDRLIQALERYEEVIKWARELDASVQSTESWPGPTDTPFFKMREALTKTTEEQA